METPWHAAGRLKQLRALSSSEQLACHLLDARQQEEASASVLASRAWRNLCHASHGPTLRAPLPAEASDIARPEGMCAAPDPSVPPSQLRAYLGAYGALVAVLRREPELLTAAVHHSGVAPSVAASLLLGSVWCHLWRPDDAISAGRAVAHAIRLRADDAGAPHALARGSLPERLAATYLRLEPQVGSWLQTAVGATLDELVARAVARPPPATPPGGAGQPPTVAAAATTAAAAAEAVLESILAFAPCAPCSLRDLCAATRDACGPAIVTELVLRLLVAPAVATPEG